MVEQQPAAFGDLLRRYRARAGLTQEGLAERAGLAAATIGALERGARRRPYRHTRQQLAEALGLSAEERAAFVGRQRPVDRSAPEPQVSLLLPRTNLPVQRTPLIGRGREAAAVRALVLHDPARLVTLTGVGGSGKTRLAIEVAAGLDGAFAGGVWLAELAPVADGALVPQAVAAALGVDESAGLPLFQSLVNWLRLQPRLLVLDNCEHLVDACAQVVERLLSACPDLHILATSREPLQISGERQWRVPPLAAPDPEQSISLDALAHYPAVQLFLARAQAVAPDFCLSDENAAAVAQICARLDGLPLALELAAARVRVLAVGQILDWLDDTICLLTGGSRAAPTRQQTLQAALDWSFNLLTLPEQVAFRRLAVFAGGCDLEAAEAVCLEPVLDLVTRLVDRSLLLVEQGRPAARYRLLEPVRQYALRKLRACDEFETVQARHTDYYLALAERAEPELRGPAQIAWLDRLESEQDNLRAALHRAEARADAETGLRLAVALGPFWEARSRLGEGRHWIDTLLGLPEARAVPVPLRARALLAGGRLAQWQGHLEEAASRLNEALVLARALDRHEIAAEALVYLGTLRRRQGAFEDSALLLEESLALYRAGANSGGIALALMTLGVTVRYQGDADRSVSLLEESLARFQELGDLYWIAITQSMLGASLRQQGRLARAAALLVEGLTGQRAVGDRAFHIFGRLDLAAILAAQAQPVRAARLLGAIAALCQSLDTPLAPISRAAYEQILEALQHQLSGAALSEALAAGRSLTVDQVLAEVSAAVQLASSPAGTAAPAGAVASP